MLNLLSISSKISSNGVYFYNALFNHYKINAIYRSVVLDSIDGLRNSFNSEELYAASIASPFKIAVIKEIDSLSESAKLTGSVNSIKNCNVNGLIGHNADFEGSMIVVNKILKNIKEPIVEIYGSGGVVPSLIKAIYKLSPDARVRLNSRNSIIGKKLCSELDVSWEDSLGTFYADLWINATPISLTEPAIIAQICKKSNVVFDLVPVQGVSTLEAIVTERGQKFVGGFDFYKAQFFDQFKFYFNFDLDEEVFNELTRLRSKK